MQAVILAGGKGRRLMPYTTVLPKPLMPIGEYPILEVILRQLDRDGFSDVVISTGYLHELIMAYVDNRVFENIAIRYSHESEPLGTIGPLRLVEGLEDDFLVMNGDILTDIEYRDLFSFHHRKGGLATIATYPRDVPIDFGVLECDDDRRIHSFHEKPTYHFTVSMGIYLFSRDIFEYVPDTGPFGFDDLMMALTGAGAEVYSYPHDGFWLDIGRPDDYAQSIEIFEENRDLFLP
ncbi:MAG: nucleotidyltransferase family protein [Methanomicrobiales archaeon]